MTQQNQKPMSLTPEYIFSVIIRRHWLLILPFCLAVVIGMVLAVKLPRIYEASTLILVEPQRVPTSYVSSVIPVGIEARISTIRQQVLSRTNLEKVIDQFRLYSEPQHEKMFLEDKVENVRRRIDVNLIKTHRNAEAFSISFKDQEPPKVMQVANALATYFIDQNLKAREAHAMGTSSFLENELNTMRERLVELETALKDYRKRYMGALPEQLESNLRVLDRIQTQLSEKQQGLRMLKEQLASLEMQMSMAQSMETEAPIMQITDMMESTSPESQELQDLKERLEDLQLRYTDQHPDVLKLKKMIARLEEKTALEETEAADPSETAPEAADPALSAFNFVDFQKTQKESLLKEIHTVEEQIAKLNRAVEIYDARVEETPKREQELLSLKRDYENINGTYNSLLRRKLEAEIAVNMEKKQKGEQFRILDSARIPEKPISPNLKHIFLLSILAGLGLGGGLLFLLEYYDETFRRPKDIESLLGISVVATFPVLRSEKEKRFRFYKNLAGAAGAFCSIGLLLGFYVLTEKGVEETILFIKKIVATIT